MHFRIIEEGYVEVDNSANHEVMTRLEKKKKSLIFEMFWSS